MIKERKNIDIILPCHFFGSVNVYAHYLMGNVFWEANENFQKKSMRNRCQIKTAIGPKSLHVPLKAGKNNQLPIKEVEISYTENWVKNLRHSLITNYSASPYMDYYIEPLFHCLNQRPKFLWDLNWELNQLLIDSLDIKMNVLMTEQWQKEYFDGSIDLRLNSGSIELQYKYPQLFEEKGLEYIPNLSILDLLFCCGPEAQIHLRNIADQIIEKNNIL